MWRFPTSRAMGIHHVETHLPLRPHLSSSLWGLGNCTHYGDGPFSVVGAPVANS